MKISELQEISHDIAVIKGWWDKPRTFGEIIALCHSELSEALEEHRNGHDPTLVYQNKEKAGKPEGVPIELADCLIRIADVAQKFGINLEEALLKKIEYNRTRPYRHGGKAL